MTPRSDGDVFFSKTTDFKKENIKQILDGALSKLVENDAYLLEKGLHERTIAHWLAVYLYQIFNNPNWGDEAWDVDCEYNKINDSDAKFLLSIRKIKREINKESQSEGHVYPDIIVHQRGSEKNLLAIEIKKVNEFIDIPENGIPPRDCDEAIKLDVVKTVAYIKELKYEYAAFIQIKKEIASVKVTILDEHSIIDQELLMR